MSRKTEELIRCLAAQPRSSRSMGATQTILWAAGIAAIATWFSSSFLLSQSVGVPLFETALDTNLPLKVAFGTAVVAAALPIVRDLSIPGKTIGWAAAMWTLPFILVTALAIVEIMRHPVSISHAEDHSSWIRCLWQIPILALPATLVLAIGVRRLAPTNLMHTGAYIGLMSGGLGGICYSFHCHEDSITIVAAGYGIAMLEMMVIGAFAGRYLLRWR